MKILIFNWRDLKHTWAGGAEISIFEHASRWVKMGHHVQLFCGDDYYKKMPFHEIVRGIHVYRRGGRFSVYIWAIWFYLTRFRGNADIVVDVENGIPFFTPLFCRVPKICFVHHVHGKQFFYELRFPISHIGFLIERYIFPLFYIGTPIITVSKSTKKALVELGFSSKNIHVIYNGIQSKKSIYKNSIKKFSSPTILYLGRIKAYKRIHLLVKLFPKILAHVPNARLFIAGWGTEASFITDLAMRSPYRKKIRLIGPVSNSEKKQLLAKSWVFVNPSIGEGWSMAVIEANLHGTPAIGFNVDGLAESIQHEKTGLLAKDEDDFIDKICFLLTNKIMWMSLSNHAKEWAKKFDWDDAAAQSIKIMRDTYIKHKT